MKDVGQIQASAAAAAADAAGTVPRPAENLTCSTGHLPPQGVTGAGGM